MHYYKDNYKMRSKSELKESRTTRTIDAVTQRAKQLLPYLQNNRLHPMKFKLKKRRQLFKIPTQTHVVRYDENNGTTVLNIRFASAEPLTHREKQDRTYIGYSKRILSTEPNQQQSQEKLLPYVKSKRFHSPEEYLKNVGYNSDLRIATQIYSDKIQEKKFKYINKIQALKRDLENYNGNQRRHRMQRSRIQVKILGEQIRRKRQRQILAQEERKGHRLLHSLLNPIHESLTP